ncbi:MAG TPA: hypothetical protein DCX53_15740 [Anaerolineae bacterium]|nr:hypothetical protein [Anaerolineae bacterium]
MNILVVTPYYTPDLGPSAPMFALLAEQLVSRGHTVTVACAAPHYPSGHVHDKYRNGLWKWDEKNGVRICRVRIPSGNRANLLHRLWVFLVYQLLVTLAGLRLQYDTALITNPAIETFLPFAILCWLRRKPSVFAVWDVYPEVGVRMGLFRNPILIWLVKLLEDFCLRRTNCIHVLSDGFLSELAQREIDPDRVAVIPPWLDTDLIRPLPRLNSYSIEHNLDECFVVLYAGNIGLSQGLETVLESAQILANRPDIVFLFVGEGAGRAELLDQAAGLGNVRFLPTESRERLPEVLATADVSLVAMKKNMGSVSLPSKLFSILASGRPVIASVDEDSDSYKLVNSSQAGMCVEPESPSDLAKAILNIKNDPLRRLQMGRDGRAWVLKFGSSYSAAEQFENLLMNIMGDGK